jgi:alginate O-acetyltransferase complex protein AlgJ
MIELIEKTRSSAFGFFDLRPIMWIVRSQAPAYFLYDTHWTARAALDGFNAIVKADGHSEWLMDADAALTPPAQHQGGDLARMIDVSDAVAEPRQKIDLSAPPFPSYVATSGEPGETIMIIGESFTEAYFAPMLLKHVGRVVW